MGMLLLKYLMVAASSFFLYFTVFYMSDKTFKRQVHWRWSLLVLAIATLMHIIFTIDIELQGYRAFISFGVTILFPVLFYAGDTPWRRGGFGVLVVIFFILVDLVQGILYVTFFSSEITIDFSYKRHTFYLITLAIIGCFYPKIHQVILKIYDRFRFSFYQIFMMLTIFIFQTMVSNYIGIQIEVLDAEHFLFFFALMFFEVSMDCLMLYLFYKMDKILKLEQEQALMKQQEAMKRSYYKVLERHYKDSRVLLHDIKNHIITIEGLYESGDCEMAADYIAHVMNHMKEMAEVVEDHRKKIGETDMLKEWLA